MIYDVAIIGGGVAGTAAGITLRKYTKYNVVIIEKDDFQCLRVGETVSASILNLLEYLDADTDFVDMGSLPSLGNSAAWGTSKLQETHSLFSTQGNNWHIDRLLFDKRLLLKYISLGGKIHKNDFRNAEFLDGYWTLTSITDDKNTEKVKARFIIEASGRKCIFARGLKIEKFALDKLSSVFTYFHLITPIQNRLLIEACEFGWWYCAPLPGNRTIISLMTDFDVIRRDELYKPEKWMSLLSKTNNLKQISQLVSQKSKLFIKPAHTQILSQIFDESWIAAGDAACAFDPISSLGIGHAITSGIHASRCAIDLLDKKNVLAEQYARHILENLKTYLSIKKEFYNIEQRWKNHIFWKRRHN